MPKTKKKSKYRPRPKLEPATCVTELCAGKIKRVRGRSKYCPPCRISHAMGHQNNEVAREIARQYGLPNPVPYGVNSRAKRKVKPKVKTQPAYTEAVLSPEDQKRVHIWRIARERLIRLKRPKEAAIYSDAINTKLHPNLYIGERV